jgi:hypothetical protein
MNYTRLNTVFLLLCAISMQPAYSSHCHPNLRSGSSHSDNSVKRSVNCPICQEDVVGDGQIIRCKMGHVTCKQCIERQIESTKNIADIRYGLQCSGDISQRAAASNKRFYIRCKDVLPFDQIHPLISDSARVTLNKRLTEAAKPTDQTLFDEEVKRLSKSIHEAFNLCCPVEGCGLGLDCIEGCNAAKCSNKECGVYYCYLCGETQKSIQQSHQHAREVHSNNAWEYRPGYTERYHWLLVRKELAYLFKGNIDPAIREIVLHFHQNFLEENSMWPFPAGLMTKEWIEEVLGSQLTSDRKIMLLQNEAIFQRKENDLRNEKNAAQIQKIALLDTEIR